MYFKNIYYLPPIYIISPVGKRPKKEKREKRDF